MGPPQASGPRSNPSIVEANLKVAEELYRYSGIRNLSLFETPWDKLVLYRTLTTDRVGEQGKSILTEADSVHRRFLFCQGVALSFFLLAVQSFIGLLFLLLHTLHILPNMLLPDRFLPRIGPHWLFVIALIGMFVSFGLRFTAGRWWEYELVLTSSLTQIEQQK